MKKRRIGTRTSLNRLKPRMTERRKRKRRRWFGWMIGSWQKRIEAGHWKKKRKEECRRFGRRG